MNKNYKDWTEDVLNSMKNSKRAKPGAELFAKIESRIAASEGKIVPMKLWRSAAAAAIIIFLVNTSVVMYYFQSKEVSQENIMVANTHYQSPISDYQIYD